MKQQAQWTATGWGIRVKSQDQLMRAVSRIGTLQVGRRVVWRGVKDHTWHVRSSISRAIIEATGVRPTERDVRASEQAILKEARDWGVGRDLGAAATDLQLLAHLQHHGVSTRLLDVTSNPMTALWFACELAGSEREPSGALLAFDVSGLPELPTVGLDPAPMTWRGTSNPLGFALEAALKQSAAAARPFLVRPTFPDARMNAQEGLFIAGALPDLPPIPGVDDLPLEATPPPGPSTLQMLVDPTDRGRGRPRGIPFCVVVIPSGVKRRMLPHLEGTYNRSPRVLFPDVDGFREAIVAGRIPLFASVGLPASSPTGP